MKYDKILFDLDNTIIDFDDTEKTALEKASKEFNVSFSKKLLSRYHEINDNLWKQLEKGEVDRKNLIYLRFKKLFDEFNILGIEPLEFNTAYMKNIAFGKKLIKNASETVKKCSNLGAKCYIITNGSLQVQYKRLDGQPFMDYISGIAISEEVGAAKPSKDFFTNAEKRFNVKFDSKTLIVGDSLTSDILGGVNAGINTCYVNRKNLVNNSTIKPTYEISDIKDLIDIII